MRWDGGVGAGSEIGLHYDPLLGKLIVWAAARDEAIARMRRALLELTIVGVETSRDFHLRVMDDPEFQRGAIDIQWLERRLASLTAGTWNAGRRARGRDRRRAARRARARAGVSRSRRTTAAPRLAR